MSRSTIDFGIDLGTTNSCIAVSRGPLSEIIRNNDNQEITPSAVWNDKKGVTRVGQLAKNKAMSDSKNVFLGFKGQMGSTYEYQFERSGRRMKAEELSAAVLKSLKEDVAKRLDEDLQAAVITVPASFELPQCEATRNAALLAGIKACPLILEPVAAALAYRFDGQNNRATWLVYDLGGGTFDAAIMQIRDGEIHVANNGGNNRLGGKLFDWAIVEQVLIPFVVKEFGVKDFQRGDRRWAEPLAILKWHAEEAKIRLSQSPTTTIEIDDLFKSCSHYQGEEVTFEFELERSQIEPLIEPFVESTINICKEVLDQKRLGAGQIEKVLLVGGPTLTPYLRERLADARKGLGIPLDFSIDPFTTVARGASIYAGGVRLDTDTTRSPAKEGTYHINLAYEAQGLGVDTTVEGRVLGFGSEDTSGFTIEFINSEARPPWRSGKITLSQEGAFAAELLAEKNRLNTYEILLTDHSGTKLKCDPAQLTYTVLDAVFDGNPPLVHSVGVALANNDKAGFFPKGTSLPASLTIRNFRTVVSLSRGQSGQLVRIPVMEGESDRADRNTEIGSLCISAEKIKRDLPAGSEVDISIHINTSRLVTVKAFVFALDEEFEKVINYGEFQKKATMPELLRTEVRAELKRYEDLKEIAHEVDEPQAAEVIERIERTKLVEAQESSLAAAGGDHTAAVDCLSYLITLRNENDKIEDAVKLPALRTRAEQELEIVRQLIENPILKAKSEEKMLFAAVEGELADSTGRVTPDYIERRIHKLNILKSALRERSTEWWIGWFEYLEKMRDGMNDLTLADSYLIQGRRAISSGDLESLKAAVRQLVPLLPEQEREQAQTVLSDIIR